MHIVKAHEPALSILRKVGVPSQGGLVHSFSGNFEIAKRYIELGLTLSVSGAITRKGFESLKRAVVMISAKSLVLETDSPDQEPAHLMGTAKTVALLRNEDPEDVLKKSAENLQKIFGLKK